MKYHLGCGSCYLEGYVNVDFPMSEHTANIDIKADLTTDILKMSYEPCEEVRSHHFFEHFNYPDSLALLYKWTRALVTGGKLIVDVPDIEALCKAYLNDNILSKFRVIRYLYGSHEAKWAYHINGWSKDTLSFILEAIGYHISSVKTYGERHSIQPNCGVCLEAVLEKKPEEDTLKNTLLRMLSYYKNGDTDFEDRLNDLLRNEFLNKIRGLYCE